MSAARVSKTVMTKAVLLGVALAAFAVATPSSAQAQAETATVKASAFVLDGAKAKAGSKVFGAKACMGCHTIGKGRLAGPDLAGLLDRRDETWVRTWLKDPTPMFESDSTAKALLKEYNNVKMPNMKLTDEQIDQVLHYIVETGSKAKKK
jgi:mono/diheme cytochrome c family protein